MNIIMKLREEQGLSRYALAKKTGLVQSTLLNLENEHYNLKNAKYITLEKIANALGVTVEYLVKNS